MHSILGNIKLLSYPYPAVFSERCLPEDYYRKLQDTRPEWRGSIEGNNKRYDTHAYEILSDYTVPQIWKDFVGFHTSARYWIEWCRVFGDSVRAYYPWFEWAMGKKLEDLDVGVRGEQGKDIYLECQLSINSPVQEKSSVIGPHLDNPTELFGALLYMRDDSTAGGDFEVHLCDNPKIMGKRLVTNSEPVLTLPYAKNSFAGFLNTYKSVHAVTPRDVTPNLRKMVNFTIELCDEKKKLFNPEIYR